MVKRFVDRRVSSVTFHHSKNQEIVGTFIEKVFELEPFVTGHYLSPVGGEVWGGWRGFCREGHLVLKRVEGSISHNGQALRVRLGGGGSVDESVGLPIVFFMLVFIPFVSCFFFNIPTKSLVIHLKVG